MDSDKKCIILTDNTWLYSGLSLQFLGVRWCRMTSNSYEIADVPESGKIKDVFILFDSLLLFQGGVSLFLSMVNQYPDAKVIWLCHPMTGLLFPASRPHDMWLSQKSGVRVIRHKLTKILELNEGNLVPKIRLTRHEYKFMSRLLSGIHIPMQSKIWGVTEKTLYAHQHNILRKVGFRTMGRLCLLSKKNTFQPEGLWWANLYWK